MSKGQALSGFVLAGGRSKRMGSNKALLPLAGHRLVDRAVELLEPHVAETFVVGSPKTFPAFHVPVIPDEVQQAGPLGGILTGLRHAQNERSLVLGVDLPFLTGEILERILALVDESDLLIPKIGEKFEPLCAVYAKSCITHIEGMLMAGRKSIHDLMPRIQVHTLSPQDLGGLEGTDPFFNINTRGDFEAAKRRLAEPHIEGVHRG